MLKIEKLKDLFLNYDTENCEDDFNCYLSRIATNSNDNKNICRVVTCSECVRLSLMNLLEEYKELYELTVLEFRILRYARELGYRFVACNFDGEICFYRNKPDKKEIAWSDGGDFSLIFNFGLFSFIKWEDAEPREIYEILANCTIVGGDEDD
ncbi:MAG: hypothetical protein KH000_11160 [Coprococcus comes]|nr:hypothetical protein [Coprococcus comes]